MDMGIKIIEGFTVNGTDIRFAFPQLTVPDGFSNSFAEFVWVHRLQQIVDGTCLQGEQGIFFVSCNKNNPVILFWNGMQKSKTIFFGHGNIKKNKIHIFRF